MGSMRYIVGIGTAYCGCCSIYGGELFDRAISEDFLLTERACVCIMRQICEAVEFIHSRHIIHLDVKVRHLRLRPATVVTVSAITALSFILSLLSPTCNVLPCFRPNDEMCIIVPIGLLVISSKT